MFLADAVAYVTGSAPPLEKSEDEKKVTDLENKLRLLKLQQESQVEELLQELKEAQSKVSEDSVMSSVVDNNATKVVSSISAPTPLLRREFKISGQIGAEVTLKINVSKTKCMTTDKINTNLHLTIDNNEISQVTEFIYLGHKISSKHDGLVAVQHRIGLGWAAFNKNKAVLTSKRVSYHLKSNIFNTYVIPVVLYGLECVNWTSKSLQKLVVFQNHMMRFMTNKRLSDHTRIEDLLRTTKLTPITSTIKSKVLKLYGHTKCSTQGVSRICLEGMIEGRRSRGRQPKRWRGNISLWTGRNLMSLNTAVKDRKNT